MRHILFLALVYCMTTDATLAQSFKSENQLLYFSSEAALDNFEAATNQSTFSFDSNSLELRIEAPLSSFEYEASLKQTALGKDVLNISEHPMAIFEGRISGVEKKNGMQSGLLKGKWILGGKEVEESCEVAFGFGKGVVSLKGEFELATEDFGFDLPEDLEFYISDLCLVNFETEMEIVIQ